MAASPNRGNLSRLLQPHAAVRDDAAGGGAGIAACRCLF